MDLNSASERQRRIAQFAQALKPMHHRTVKKVKDCCYAIIEERDSTAEFFASLKASKQTSLELSTKPPVLSICGGGIDRYNLEPSWPDGIAVAEGWSKDGWRADEDSNRFIQFVFLEKHFEMDLPRPMLFAAEAVEILRNRSGFFFMSDKPGADASTVNNYNPLRKAYVHGDVTTAAEDMAWIFFDLWKFPTDERLYLSTFGGDYQWERGKPLE